RFFVVFILPLLIMSITSSELNVVSNWSNEALGYEGEFVSMDKEHYFQNNCDLNSNITYGQTVSEERYVTASAQTTGSKGSILNGTMDYQPLCRVACNSIRNKVNSNYNSKMNNEYAVHNFEMNVNTLHLRSDDRGDFNNKVQKVEVEGCSISAESVNTITMLNSERGYTKCINDENMDIQMSCKMPEHVQNNHNEETTNIKLRCQKCKYTCLKEKQLQLHMTKHTKEKPFSCTKCDYTCMKLCNLREHQQTHEGDKSFSCSICEYKCSKLFNLKRHMHTHSGVKPFLCSICSNSYSKKEAFKSHMKSHSGKNTYALYSCRFCDYTCSQTVNLKTHMSFHTGDRSSVSQFM
ncbi:unnamed protein product, partial [Meganyctiphanes norvegica]